MSYHGAGEKQEMSLFRNPFLLTSTCASEKAAWPEVLLINLTSGSNPGVLPNKTARYNMHTPG